MLLFASVLVLCQVISGSLGEFQSCPPGCFCDRKRVDSLPILEGQRVHCVQLSNEKFYPHKLPNNTLQLDLNGYGLTAITSDFFRNVKYLEKVDLSNNQISYLDEEALHSLGFLKSLDLSYNKLTVLTMDTLVGLTSLERLKLNNNKLQTIEFGAFSHLSSIQKIDLSENPLLCDCNLAWLVDQDHWLDIAGARARCGAPDHLLGASIKKLSVTDMTCNVPLLPTLTTYNTKLDMGLEPSEPQVVFIGDSLRLICHVGLLTNEIMVRWFHNDKLTDHSSVTSITELGPSKHRPSLSKQSQLYIGSLQEEHSGNWTCSALVDTGHVQNISVSVAVISAGVVLCPATSTNSSKGVYQWGVTMAASLATQHCHNSSQETGQQMSVTYQCQQDGTWGVLNDTACGHTSDVTDKLYRFAYMNNSDFDQNTLIQSARKLLEFTSVSASFQDGMDIVYLSRVLENYLPYLSSNTELASLLVDIAANAMRMSPDIIYQGQLLGHAASRLIATIANISRIIPAFQHQRSSLAIESFKVSPQSFAGITCSWYSDLGDRVLHCTDNNVTVTNHARTLLGSAQLPGTLYYQLELHDRDVNIVQNIMFTALQNATFFPQISSTKDSETVTVYKVVSSCVLGASLVAAEPFNLSEPVYIIMKLESGVEYSSDIVPGWWDPRSNSGLGSWQTQHCKVMKAKRESVVFSCNRLGFYALLSPGTSDPGHNIVVTNDMDSGVTVSQMSRYTPVHSAVYTTTIISVILLCSTVCMFTYLYSRIEITKKLKHALPNFWMSLIFFIVFYALSISVQSAKPLCQCVGILLHYFILTTFLWLTMVANIVYKKLVNPRDMAASHSTNPYVVNPEEEVYVGQNRVRKPTGQYYLVGWGVPLIIVGITAGASIQQYTQSGYDWCFLSLAPAIGAILIPVVLISLIYLFFIIAILSFSSGKLETKLVSTVGSSSTLMVTDSQHSHRSHCSVLVMVFMLLVTMMVCAVMAVTAPLPSGLMSPATQHSVFSVLYSVLTCLLSLVILVYYALMRHDIVHCKWSTGQDETSNLVELNNHRQVQTLQPQHNTYIMDNMIKPGYHPMVELGGSVLGPSTGDIRLKQCNLDRNEEDYHSLNNSQHLSRPMAMETDNMFGPSAKIKVNNVNIHMAEESQQGWYDHDWSRPCYQRPPAPPTDHDTAGSPMSPMELPYPDISHLIMPSANTVSNSLPRKSGRRQDRRRRNVNGIQSDVERADQIYTSSRFSEVSSSTAASVRSKSSRSKKNKPRRKPRKRSEVFPTSSSGGSCSKRYDPIMEVSYTMDNEEEEVDETNDLLSKENDLIEDPIDYMPGEDVCHNNTDEEQVDDDIIDGGESLASKLLNRETCV